MRNVYGPITPDQERALHRFAKAHGRYWKRELNYSWMAAAIPGPLQALRNSHGPSWLIGYKLPANIEEKLT